MKEIETTTAPRATPDDIARIWRQFWGDKEMPMYNGWTESDEQVQSRIAHRKMGGRGWLAKTDDEKEQVALLQTITAENQAEYFDRLNAELEADADWLDLRNTEASQG